MARRTFLQTGSCTFAATALSVTRTAANPAGAAGDGYRSPSFADGRGLVFLGEFDFGREVGEKREGSESSSCSQLRLPDRNRGEADSERRNQEGTHSGYGQ